jgi:hypothetical protein
VQHPNNCKNFKPPKGTTPKKMETLEQNLYTAMKNGDLDKVKQLCKETQFWVSERNGYYSPFESAIICEFQHKKRIVEIMCDLAPVEVLNEFRFMLITYGHITVCEKYFGLKVCPNAMEQAAQICKKFEHPRIECFQEGCLLGVRVVFYAEYPDEIWEYLKCVYHNGDTKSLFEKRYCGSRPYSPSVDGSQVCYWTEGCFTRIGISFYPGEYSNSRGDNPVVWKASPIQPPVFEHPFDAAWNLFPAP